MQKTVVIVGAGGKMGVRSARAIGRKSEYKVLMCENNEERARRLAEAGFTVTPLDDALAQADFALLAVPDAVVMRMAQSAVPKLQAGGTSIILDAAAAYLGGLPHRDDVTQMIAHPCHPPFFTEQATPEARADFFGGVAFQDLIVSLVEGSERSFADGIELCATIFAPIRKVYRVTPEQFALLEPAMAEMVTATAATLIRASLEAAVEKGVPREAAEAFLAGHAQIALAMCFGAEKSPFSDAAQRAVQWGMQEIIQPDWKKAFEPEVLKSAIEYMLQSDEAPKPAAASVD